MERKLRRALWASLCVCVALWAAGCGGDVSPDGGQAKDDPTFPATVDKVLVEVDGFTSELVQKVETASDPSAGVDEAQKFLDAGREQLAGKIGLVKNARGFETNEGLRKRMLESEISNGARVSGLQTKYISRSMEDAAFKAKLDKLVNDYQLMFKV